MMAASAPRPRVHPRASPPEGTIPTPNTFGAICAKTEMKLDISRIPKGCILTRKRYLSYDLKDTYSYTPNKFLSPLQNY